MPLKKAVCLNTPNCEWVVGKGCKCTRQSKQPAEEKQKLPSPKVSSPPKVTQDPFKLLASAYKDVFKIINSIKTREDVNNVATKISDANLSEKINSNLMYILEKTAQRKKIHYDS
jgi:hypothetical protein